MRTDVAKTVRDWNALDVTGPTGDVEVAIRDDGKVLWVNVGGVCLLRICRIDGPVKIDDRRKHGL
jgi:hypothetical protein